MAAKKRLLSDIRYYEVKALPKSPAVAAMYNGCAIAISREMNHDAARTSCLLRSLGFVSGRKDHIYLLFTQSIPAGVQTKLRSHELSPWAQEIGVGVSTRMLATSDRKRRQFVAQATTRVLRALFPSQKKILNKALRLLRRDGDSTQIRLRSLRTARYEVNAYFDVPAVGKPAHLTITRKSLDSARSSSLLAKTIKLKDFEDAYHLVSRLSCSKDCVTLHPRTTFSRYPHAKFYRQPIKVAFETVQT